MKKLMIRYHLCYIVLFVAVYSTTLSEGANPSVTLTVEGGGSLIGEHCRGTAKLLCCGVDLSIIRWRFNGNTDVVTFFSDNVAPSPFTNNPAFLNAELLSTVQNPVDPNFANFSSELLVDLSQLQTESVSTITCGDPDTSIVIPVDVEIIQQTVPDSPTGTNVTALYEFESLTDVTVSWEKLEARCPEFQTSLVYQVSLSGSSVVAVNHTSCGEVCIVSFQNFSDASEEYRVSLYAENAVGASEVVEYPTTIVKQSRSYFTPIFVSSDCLFIFECQSVVNIDANTCIVLYTTDSMFTDPLSIVAQLNTEFEITGTTPDIVYYFEFSVSVNETLLVRNRITERAISSPRLSVLVIVFQILSILAIISNILGATFGIVLCVFNGLPAKILFFGAFLLGILSLIFIVFFSIITGIQQDTCSLGWSRTRDALIISAFIFALFGNMFMVCFLLISCVKKKSGKMDVSTPMPEDIFQLEGLEKHKDNIQSIIEVSSTGSPEDTKEKPKETNIDSEACNGNTSPSGDVQNRGGELESSADIKFTVYKVVVTLKGHFLFRRYREFVRLLEEVREEYPSDAKLLKLPGKRFVNNFAPDFIKERQIGLNEFVTDLMKIDNILAFLPVRKFLAMDDQRLGLRIYDNETIDEPADEEKVAKEGKVKHIQQYTEAKITDLDLLKVIGIGTFGKVYLGRNKENRTKFYAIKVLPKKVITEPSEVEHIMARRNAATHPFLVGLHYSFQTSTKLYFVMEYVNGGTLFFHLQRERVFSESRARFYAAEITSALGYLHKLEIIYWDLKLQNTLLDVTGHIVLTDFGIKCEDTIFGIPEQVAPEVLNKQEYEYSVDWWSLGVVTYEMMHGLPPFYSQDVAQLHDNILNKPPQLERSISSNARSLLKGLLQKDKSVRLGKIGDDKNIKDHPFFKSVNWDDLFEKKVEPPFKPREKDALDLRQFDPIFKDENISDTPHGKEEDLPFVSVANSTFNVMK